MFILKAEEVDYCTLSKQAADVTTQVPGLEYQHKLYVKGETYDPKDRQIALQQARQKLLEMKGQATLLIEEDETITLWYQDKTVQKVNLLLTVDLKQLVAAMRTVGGIQIKDRQFRLKSYHQCFVGSEAVDWLVADLDISRQAAVRIGQRLIDEGWIHHVLDQQVFQDEYFFYRFRWDEQ
ncbi:MAG: mechanosensitive ion channel protein [Cyanobacteria bacterium P01_G01_bin.38]